MTAFILGLVLAGILTRTARHFGNTSRSLQQRCKYVSNAEGVSVHGKVL